MQLRRSALYLVLAFGLALLSSAFLAAQTTNKAAKAPALPIKPEGDLAQVMRGILFTNSNVIFAVQSTDPTKVKQDEDPTLATNPLAGTFGGWQAVENSSIALAEAANLISIPGRVCSNGKPVPLHNADWAKYVQGLRDASMEAYKAAQAKNQDAILDVADKLTTACANCHTVYREKTTQQGGLSARCTK